MLTEATDPSSSESTLSPDSILPSTNDKRSIDENDQPHMSKRLRSSCSQASSSSSSNTTIVVKWIPPSQQCVTQLHTQSPSLFHFTRCLINNIISSTDHYLTDEHFRWLHSTLNLFNSDHNNEKFDVLIQTAYEAAKRNLVR
jgi:hypothetical protein